MARLQVCLLWHMHQPVYRDPETAEYILPWVRLHGTRAYYDMPKVLGEFEGARAVFNLAPSLLWQLEEYVRGEAKDRFLDLTLRPADDLSAGEREFVLRNFFMIDWESNVRPLPRYWDLLHKRGRDLRTVDLVAAAAKFSVDEMRDLQVLFNLAWMGFSAEEEEPVVAELKAKGRDFTEEDKVALVEAQCRVLARVLPAYRELAHAGKAELTVAPFYHPILPLLVDTNSALRAMPQASLPPRFAYPADAREQIRRAFEFAERRLEIRPAGMWPSEGSVSPEVVELLAQEGCRWCATDEGILLRSKPHRERSNGTLYRPYRVQAGERELAIIFRDRGLSDLLGFTYAKNPAREAVDDLFRHFDEIARGACGGEVPLVTIALDGENPWEHYASSGRDFLRELYRRLAGGEGGVELVTPSGYLEEKAPVECIDELHTGSWIDASFRIWIGQPEDNAGWQLLGQARAAIAEKEAQVREGAGPADLAGRVAAAKEAIYPAEGSDWFWWYGDDFATDSAAEFDSLFRGFLKASWRALGDPVPSRLDEPISRRAGPLANLSLQEPQGFIHPRLDGRIKSYFDWTGSGVCLPHGNRGAMFSGDGVFSALRFGFNERNFFVRLDPQRSPGETLRLADQIRLMVASGEKLWEFELPLAFGESRPRQVCCQASDIDQGVTHPLGRASFHDIFELGLPFEGFGFVSGDRVALAVRVMRQGVEVERIPRQGYVSFSVPDADYERKNWKA
ncbi:MAG: glycoside hydrolase family 57 protein [Myxococcales bacterium]|jgi:alpha-amylase/alpha-mannosidase (GH57 family)